ncbi:copper-binding protein [Caldimonas tepidiphila]|uniref:copper-binding protein n=1 Tax=Caldimonas tepidiphila TaxID=2315841 RepID=UPI000E5A6847|nr:copper-binding protein [Caldimonas tepidiphila]
MKKFANYAIAIALIGAHATAFADQNMGGMKGMQMDGMKGMQMEKMSPAAEGQEKIHTAKGTVKKVDAKTGMVTLAHGPVKSMNWPAMSMGFKVKDKDQLSKLTEGKSVEFSFVQSGKDYVITEVK